MQTIQRYPDTILAHIARSVLAQHGIDAFIADENLANADPPVVFATGGVRVMVPDEEIERASKILKEHAQSAELPDDFDVDEPVGADSC